MGSGKGGGGGRGGGMGGGRGGGSGRGGGGSRGGSMNGEESSAGQKRMQENAKDLEQEVSRLEIFQTGSELNVTDAIEKILTESQPTAEVQRLTDFMLRVEQGYRGRQDDPH